MIYLLIYFYLFQAKRPRVLSESENGSEDPVKEPPASNNGYGFGGMPSPDVVQTRLELLQKSFPNKVRMCCVCISFLMTFFNYYSVIITSLNNLVSIAI
jgi:hypothetical protein